METGCGKKGLVLFMFQRMQSMISENVAHPCRCGMSEMFSLHHGPESIDQFRKQ